MFIANNNGARLEQIATEMAEIQSEWSAWTPVLTWGTATPVGIVTNAKYKIIGKTLFYNIRITATNGNGSTFLHISLPVVPKTNNIQPFVSHQIGIGASYTVRFIRLYDDGSTNNIRFMYTTMTSGSAVDLSISGFYEID
jgi:hypothetical protein